MQRGFKYKAAFWKKTKKTRNKKLFCIPVTSGEKQSGKLVKCHRKQK